MSEELLPAGKPGSDLEPSVDAYSRGLLAYIGGMGLPTAGVLVPVAERRRVIVNLPEVVSQVPADRRTDAMYISKFTAACSGGLFDAALNYLWDETVVNLRAKVVRFDLAYFYASAIDSEDQRKNYKTEDDLVKLDDWSLVRGCRHIGILSEVGYMHLDHIRGMRNWASAAHPNHTELTGLQLIAWLETCIREVLVKEPSGPGVEVRALLHNLRTETLAPGDVPAIEAALQQLPEEIALSLLRTVFGMFVDPKVEAQVKDNIRLVAQAAWGVSSDDAKYEVGLRYATYSANGDVTRKATAREFLDRVKGLGYLPTDTLAVELNEQLDNLFSAHIARSNYTNEVPHAKSLSRYVPENGAIPQAVLPKYVKVLLLCRMGDATWGDGVSRGAKPYYDRLIAKMQEREVLQVARLLGDNDVASRLQFQACQQNFRNLIEVLRPKVTNVHLARALGMIVGATLPQLRVLGGDSRYKTAVSSVVL